VLASSKQRQLCLGAGHADCATFRAARELLREPHREPGAAAFEAGLWPRTSPRVTTFDPVRTGLTGGLTTPQARAGGQALLVGLIVVAFVVLVLARSTPAGSAAPVGGSPVPSGAAAGASPPPSTAATPAPSLATPVPAPSAPADPTGSPLGSNPAERTYKEKRGDTLRSIALKFGVTVKALRKANGLATDAVIRRGQVLVIPAPAASPNP
jgi:LysM repeat protein